MNQQPQGTRNGVHGDNGATFEQSFGRLQEVVQKLSAGNMTLQEALSAFEEGMALADRCTQLLDSAELRIQQVSARAARAGAEAANEIESRSKLAGNQPEIPVIDVETFESALIIEPGAATTPSASSAPSGPVGGAASASGRSQWEGRSARPQSSVPPPAASRGASQSEDKYADELDLGPLFDDED